MPRHVLAFDTSTDLTSVAVCVEKSATERSFEVLAELEHAAAERHAELLLPRVQACLAQAGLTLPEIALIGVGIGPGSFTGVRVGVATAKGLGLGLWGVQVRGVVSLEALALAARARGEWLAPLLDAFKGEVFGALYRATDAGLRLEVAPFHAPPERALAELTAACAGQPLTLFGSGLRRYGADLSLPAGAHVLDPAFDLPRARTIAQLALASEGECDLAALAPLYVRDSDAQLPKTPLAL
jgi:tRNA threonylcarbamoyladenosine biosynthesis protein TsaB